MLSYPPEGTLIHTPENQARLTEDGLRAAAQSNTLIEAVPVLCDNRHDLHFDFGGFTAVMPREETALGLDTGQVREGAILTRVGKPTCFLVLQAPGGQITLSRRAAQQAAWTQFCTETVPGDIIPAVVTSPAACGAFCDIGCGLTALLPVSRISIARIRSSAERFAPGQTIFAAVTQIDCDALRATLSHRELLGTWAQNAALFSPGETVLGTVRSLREYGVFIELTPNLSGLAEPDDTLHPGERVSVYLKSIQPEKQKIKLVVLERLGPAAPPLRYFQTEGRLTCWQYRPGAPLTVF